MDFFPPHFLSGAARHHPQVLISALASVETNQGNYVHLFQILFFSFRDCLKIFKAY